MRIKSLDIGLESVTRWNVGDEIHLPKGDQLGPVYLPQYRALDEVLHRPTLDERLSDLLQPTALDPDLLISAVLSQTRDDISALFREHARKAIGPGAATLREAAELLADLVEMDEEVNAALAMLLRG